RMLFRPPPMLRDPGTVQRIYFTNTSRGREFTGDVGRYARYEDTKAYTHSFSTFAAFTRRDLAVGVGDAAREMSVAAVSAAFFDFFDAPPTMGRYFTPAEDALPEGQPVVVLSHAFWSTQFGERRDVLGQKVQIGPTVFTVIGVAP